MKNDLTDIVIVGSGLAGLTLAIALARNGVKSTIFEKRSKSDISGMGIQITPNGSQILSLLGLQESIHGAGKQIDRIRVLDSNNKRSLFQVDLSKYRSENKLGYLTFDRGVLLQSLIQEAEELGVSFRFQDPILEFPQKGNLTGITLSNATTIFPKLLVGANGVSSQLRLQLNDAKAPSKPTYYAQRYTSPMGEALNKELGNTVNLIYTPFSHLVWYPIQPEGMVNLVAVVPSKNGKQPNFEDPFKIFGTFRFAHEVHNNATKKETYELFSGQVNTVWYKGNTCLIGDALHPLLPFLAQGGNLAMEDGWVLAQTLLHSNNTSEAFWKFKSIRENRVRQVVRSSNLQGTINKPQNPMYRFLRTRILQFADTFAPNLIFSNYDWIFNFPSQKIP